MNAKEILKQAVRQVCEEAGEPWEELYEDDFDDATVSKTAEVFAKLVLAEHAAELDALRAENARLRAELEAVGAEAFALKSRCEQLQSAMEAELSRQDDAATERDELLEVLEGIEAAIAKVKREPTQ